MKNLAFWRKWSFSLRIFFFFSFTIFLGVLFTYVYLFYLGSRATISWEHTTELEVVPIIVDTFTQLFHRFDIEADSYILIKTFKAGNLNAHWLVHYLYFGSLLLGMNFFLVVISDLKKMGYLAGVTLLFFFWANMNLELLKVFSHIHIPWIGEKLFLILVILAYIPISYFFHTTNYKVGYLGRFSIYICITLILIGIAIQYGKGILPIHHLTHYTLAIPIIITILFCGINAHEIIRLIVYFITVFNNPTSTGTVKHLLILSGIYFFNLVYVYLQFTERIDWNIFYLHPFLLYGITILLGLWGWQKRQIHFENYFDVSPAGIFLYISLAIISLSSIAFALALNNTPLIEVYEDTILYTHFAFGLVFLIYIFSNYAKPLEKNRKVYKIVYKYERVNFFFSWCMGILIIILILLRGNFITYQQSFAGYFNNLAYLNLLLRDEYAAKQYYKVALGYDPLNFHANYILGNMAKKANEEAAALIFFEDANTKKQYPEIYAQVADMYMKNRKFFKALFVLREGVKNCSRSGELYNNLALLFAKTNVDDSIDFYLKKALYYSYYPEVVQTNRFLLATLYSLYNNTEPILLERAHDYIGIYVNEMAFSSKVHQSPRSFDKDILNDSILSTPELCYLYNYALNLKQSVQDSTSYLLSYYKKFQENAHFNNYLVSAQAHIFFEQGDYMNAFRLWRYLYMESNLANPYYAHLLGLRLLQIEEYEKAIKYLQIAVRRGEKKASMPLLIAFFHLNDSLKAVKNLKSISTSLHFDDSKTADFLSFIDIDKKNPLTSDTARTVFIKFHGLNLSDDLFDSIISTIQNKKIKAHLLSNRMTHYLNIKNFFKAKEYLDSLQSYFKNGISDSVIDMAYLEYHQKTKNWNKVFLGKLSKTKFPKTQSCLEMYYLGSYYRSQNMIKEAIRAYRKALIGFPFKEQLWIDLFECYLQMKKEKAAYKTLLRGYEINPNSHTILQRYILQCVRMGYDSFAEFAMQDLQLFLSHEKYESFQKVYEKEKKIAKKY